MDIVLNNRAYLDQHKDTLAFTKNALKFSGYAFLALGVLQTCAMKPPTAFLDSDAYGIFLLDAARRVSKLLKNEAKKSAQDQLTDALESIAMCHSIFAWVTAMLVLGLFAEVSGLQAAALKWAEDNDAINYVLGLNDYYYVSFKLACAAAFGAGLKFGGYDYIVGKLAYWTKASKVGKELVAHKIDKVPNPASRDALDARRSTLDARSTRSRDARRDARVSTSPAVS